MRNKSVGVGVANTNSIVKDVTKFILVIMMSETRFILCQDDLGNYEIRYDDKVFHFLWEVAPILNEQQAIIRRDEISIKTMMSNMKKLEEENEQLKKEIRRLECLNNQLERRLDYDIAYDMEECE